MDARMLYNQLLEEIHSDEVSLEEKRELARLLKKRFDREALAPGAALATVAAPVAATLPKTVPTPPASELPSSFVQDVEEALPALRGREFVVGDVAMVLRGKIPGLPEKINPKITTVLKRLYDNKALVRTFEGGGNVPHKYRLVEAGDEETFA